jgi:hypothetical protein
VVTGLEYTCETRNEIWTADLPTMFETHKKLDRGDSTVSR